MSRSMPADAPGVDIVIAGQGLTLVYGHVGPAYVHKGQVVRAGETLGEIPHFGPGQTSAVSLQARRGGKPTSVLALLEAEARPARLKYRYTRDGLDRQEHDAFAICAWLQERDRLDLLRPYFTPPLSEAEQQRAQLEGWILGVS